MSLLIPGDFPPVVSGIATYFYEIWRHLPKDRRLILCSREPGDSKFDESSSLKIIRHKIPTSVSSKAKIAKGFLNTFWAILLYLKYHFQTLHCGQVLSSGFTGWLMKKLFGIHYIVYVYGSETFRFSSSQFLINSIKRFLMDSLMVIPNSQFTKEEFVSLGVPTEKFHVVTPGVDIDKFFPSEKNLELMSKYNLADKLVLLTVGRLDERKGHDRVIEALSILTNQYPNLVYLIVGKGREKTRLISLSHELNIEDKVIFTGYIPDTDLPKYYNLCDIFILLNRQTELDNRLRGDYEGFGIVFLEASACAKPVVAGNYGGIADAVEDGKSGYIIDGTDVNIIISKLEKLIQDKKLREELGECGLNRACKYFDWKIKSKEIEQFV